VATLAPTPSPPTHTRNNCRCCFLNSVHA
jgi:hypothetical protein